MSENEPKIDESRFLSLQLGQFQTKNNIYNIKGHN